MTNFVPYGTLTFCKNCGEQNPYSRELSEEEIGQFKGQWYRGDFNSFYDLVQAILRKASEK
jgi:hypothetical protein